MAEKMIDYGNKYLEKMQQSVEEITKANEQLFKGLETFSKADVNEANSTEREVVYEEDKLKLYHYQKRTKDQHKVPTLIIYALVNTPRMMDLQKDRSFIKNLLDDGTDVYLIEWGYPTPEDKYLTLEDYILGYIDNCVDFILKEHGIPQVNILGVCQGGSFSLMYTALRQSKVKNLITMVTPVDFDTDENLLFKWAPHLNAKKMVEAYGNIPGDFMNTGFLTLKPISLMVNKYFDLIDDLDNADAIANFLRMESWIFDSPDQAGGAFAQFITECYHENKLCKGELELGGEKVNLKNITCPVLNLYAERDHQVPNSASENLSKFIGSADVENIKFPAGHIGMFVGGRSQREIAPKVAEWLKERTKR